MISINGILNLNKPYGITLDAAGNLYIADNINARIQKWGPGATEGITLADGLMGFGGGGGGYSGGGTGTQHANNSNHQGGGGGSYNSGSSQSNSSGVQESHGKVIITL